MEAGLNSSTTRVSGPRGGRPATWSLATSFGTETPPAGAAGAGSSVGHPTGGWSPGSGSESTSSSMESYSSLEPSFCLLCRLTRASRLFLSSCRKPRREVEKEIWYSDSLKSGSCHPKNCPRRTDIYQHPNPCAVIAPETENKRQGMSHLGTEQCLQERSWCLYSGDATKIERWGERQCKRERQGLVLLFNPGVDAQAF